LIVAVVVGLAIAIGGTVLVVNVVSGHSGPPGRPGHLVAGHLRLFTHRTITVFIAAGPLR
jgi:hypothetical protein